MADAATVQIAFNGSRRAIYNLTGVSDGTGESNVKKVDLTALVDAHYGTPTRVHIYKVQYVVYGESVTLLWEGTPNKPIMTLEGHDEIDYTKYGGLKNNATSPTGNILLTTNQPAVGSNYTIVLELVEKY